MDHEISINSLNRLLAEVLRLQRWAGGESVSAARIYGLMHGFESASRSESETVSQETQDAVEDILEAVEQGKQSPDGMPLKTRLLADKIDETDAVKVMRLCWLQSRFQEPIALIEKESGGVFGRLTNERPPESNWYGSLHYMELHDSTDETHKKLHAVFSPAVPRIGEVVIPQNGPPMRVVDVEHVITPVDDTPQLILVPFVILESVEEADA